MSRNDCMPDSFFVMHEGFLQLALLLKDTGKVGVGCSELWEHLFNTHNEPSGTVLTYVETVTAEDGKKVLKERPPQELSCTAEQHLQCCPALV